MRKALFRWIPWKRIVSRLARRHGLIDPIGVVARLENLAQPAEVSAPIELVRSALVLQARGLINGKVIQQNLDWVWPYWVHRQFDPRDESFVPRAFSLTQVNLTHRNWTAIGLPDAECLPIVDPRGLVTPYWDGWSLDAWLVFPEGEDLLPSRCDRADQSLQAAGDTLSVRTDCRGEDAHLLAEAQVVQSPRPLCRVEYQARAGRAGWLVVALRPFNPEGVGEVREVSLCDDHRAWRIDGMEVVRFDRAPRHHRASRYHDGDVYLDLLDRPDATSARCKAGLPTAAAMYPLAPDEDARVRVEVDLDCDTTSGRGHPARPRPAGGWTEAMREASALALPEPRYRELYDAALRTMVLLSPGEIYPGPFTYRRFWFRDAVLIGHAMLCCGLASRVRRCIEGFFDRQWPNGYFHSQAGEWDSNGQVLWLMRRYCELTGSAVPPAWRRSIVRAAKWIGRKRTGEPGEAPHAGLMPAGFSAEHLGSNDHYYWDDWWSLAGLESGAWLCRRLGERERAEGFERQAASLSDAIDRSLESWSRRRGQRAIPASPYRRMDSGSIGSLAGGYPLGILDADDPRLCGTAEYLWENCLVDGAFYLDMIHAGLNIYLTLHLAQTFLRRGDERFSRLLGRVAELASPTGQWPEAVHPRTRGGCMGDGQHAWASAEWAMMMRACFLREEPDGLHLAGGLDAAWRQGGECSFGPTPTAFGPVTVSARGEGDRWRIRWEANWRHAPAQILVAPPGFEARRCEADESGEVLLEPRAAAAAGEGRP